MDELFEDDLRDLCRLELITKEEAALLGEVDIAADELGLQEYEHYLKHEFDINAVGIARKHGLFAINAGERYGGKGARPIVHALAQQRLGHSGLGFPTMYHILSSSKTGRYLPLALSGRMRIYNLQRPSWQGTSPSALRCPILPLLAAR